MTVFIFFMHDRVLTTFSTDWGKTAVYLLKMPYFCVMMSEYCRKSPKQNILTENISSAKPIPQPYGYSHTHSLRAVFFL